MLQPIDRKLTLVIVKSNAEVATTQEREEQLRAQIAALSCEVSLTAIDTVVKLLVLRAKKRPKTRYEYNIERVRDFRVGKEQDEARMGKGFMLPPMRSNTGTSAFLSALVEQPSMLSAVANLSQADADKQQREIIQEESTRALLYLYSKSRVRDVYMEKHTSKVQMPLATWASLTQPRASRRKTNTNDKRRRLLDLDGEVSGDNVDELEEHEGLELLDEIDQSATEQQQQDQSIAAASLQSSSAPALSLTASHLTPQISADGPAFRYDKQKTKYEYNQERKRDFRYSKAKSKQRAKLEEAQSTDKKLTGKTSYADLEEEWGAQSLISLYIRDYDKKVFDDCMQLGNNRFYNADFQHLQKLDLSHQLIGDEQLQRLWAIAPTVLQGLENLNLAGNNITDAGMKDFSKVQRSLRSLLQLNLSSNDFGDIGFSMLLLEDTFSASLRVLDISFNSLGVLAAYRLATQMFEQDRHAHLEVLFMGGRVRGRTLGDTFVQVFLHAMIQENSRIGLKRLKVLHLPDCNLTAATIDALSLYLTCDDVALRQLSVCQNTVNFLPYTSLPRKSCETKAAFISAILQNSSLHWMLSRQCNLTSADLGIIETSLSRNLRNSRLSQDKRKAKPSLDWADMQHLAIRSSIAATVCEKNFYEVLMEDTNIWNSKKPSIVKLVPFEVTHDIVAEMEHTLSRITIFSGSGDPDEALYPRLGDDVTAAMRHANILLSALDQIREAHFILRTKEDGPHMTSHTLILSYRESKNRKGRTEREKEEEFRRKELKSYQKQAIDELQRTSQQFGAIDREVVPTEERHIAAMNNLQDGLLTYRTSSAHLRSLKQREEELAMNLKRNLRNREMDYRKMAQLKRFASASQDFGDDNRYISSGRVGTPLYSPGRVAAIYSSRSPPSSPTEMLSPTRGFLDEEELQSRIRTSEKQELEVRAALAELEGELSYSQDETSCHYESLLMGVEDLSASALEEVFLLQKLVGCLHKTNMINDFWKAAFVEKREDISWALHSYLHKICPNHRTLDLAAFFVHYWHMHFFRDKELAKMKQQQQPQQPPALSPLSSPPAAEMGSMEVIAP